MRAVSLLAALHVQRSYEGWGCRESSERMREEYMYLTIWALYMLPLFMLKQTATIVGPMDFQVLTEELED